jgi:hypothetical protein
MMYVMVLKLSPYVILTLLKDTTGLGLLQAENTG